MVEESIDEQRKGSSYPESEASEDRHLLAGIASGHQAADRSNQHGEKEEPEECGESLSEVYPNTLDIVVGPCSGVENGQGLRREDRHYHQPRML